MLLLTCCYRLQTFLRLGLLVYGNFCMLFVPVRYVGEVVASRFWIQCLLKTRDRAAFIAPETTVRWVSTVGRNGWTL